MDRVGFLIEDTGERLGCMLNPETLELSRVAGVKPRRDAGAVLSGKGLKDDPILFTGGGRTELKMDLLFDIGLAGSSIQTEDVRDLTNPLWQLAENSPDGEGVGRMRLVRFVWGKAWNIPGVIAAIAERYEDFSAEGIPHRSWVRMRFLRVEKPVAEPAAAPGLMRSPGSPAVPPPPPLPSPGDINPDQVQNHEVSGERLDAIAHKRYGDPSYWRWLAAFNHIDDPLRLPAGRVVQVPSADQGRNA